MYKTFSAILLTAILILTSCSLLNPIFESERTEGFTDHYTLSPATGEPATGEPATDAPVTDAPATDAPATDAPATDAPATNAPQELDEALAELNRLIASPPVRGATVSVAYERLSDGYSINRNADLDMYAASLSKLNYCFHILRRLDAFESTAPRNADGSIIYDGGTYVFDLSRPFVYYRGQSYVWGTGKIQYYADGSVFSYRELIEAALVNSDNIAYRELHETFRYTPYYSYAKSIGVTTVKSGSFSRLSAADSVRFLREIYEYINNGGGNAEFLKDCMTRACDRNMICKANEAVTVLHKYGRDYGAYHDTAIVLDAEPYLLCIMTDITDMSAFRTDGETPAERYICEIAGCVSRINAALKVAG